ncbi:MAG: dihydropteroate synthase [Akkermansia sp.]|nr:dihydropteroate synthase [Akkermansia sp.]
MSRTWRLRNEQWLLPKKGAIMGILNVTPDSFSDGGLHNTLETALAHARKLVADGADIIDIGGESTRPGSAETPPKEEQARVVPVIQALRAEFPALRISIDTRHATTAAAALHAGADIVNDITALASADMRRVCAELPCGIILMHMQGTPTTMQQAPHYTDVVAEVRQFFAERMELAAQDGIEPTRICLDPGIGFGKTTEHNLLLIEHLESLRVLNRPILMALSRKAFMGKILGAYNPPKTSPIPTLSMSLMSADRGADLHRVHDVAELHQALLLRAALLRA